MASASIQDGQKIVARLDETDAKGNPTNAPAAWSVDRTDLATLVPAEDGLSATLAAVGPLGTVTLTATFDAALGLAPVVATIDIVGGPVAKAELAFDAPTAQ